MTGDLVALRDIVVPRTGTRDPKEGRVPSFTYVDLDAIDRTHKSIAEPKQIPSTEAPSRARKVIRANDVLVALVRPNLNAVAIVPSELDDSIASTGFCVLRSTERVLPMYLYFFVRSGYFVDRLCALVSGAMYPAVTESQVLDQRIAVPSLNEQRRIVDLLSRAENIVRMRREAEQKAHEIIPALFLDMFGDPATNRKGWEIKPLGDVAEVVSGVAKGRKLSGKKTRTVPYLRVANVQAGRLDLAEIKSIEATHEEIEDLALRAGDVLLTEGGDHDKLGRGALLEHDIGECIHQNHIFRVRANRTYLHPTYFASYLQTDLARSYFLKSAKKTTNLASINMTQLRRLPVVLPPTGLQASFKVRFSALRTLEAGQASALDVAREMFQSLLAEVFGESDATRRERRTALGAAVA